jgi:integrase
MPPRRRDRRHLVKRGSVWYFERLIDGRRFRRSLDTGNVEEARARRDALERDLATVRFSTRATPTFAAAAHDALAAMESRREAGAETGYSATTARDRRRGLRADGPILPRIGHLRLDTIDAAILQRWHDAEVVQRGRSFKTGNNLLDAIEQVFRFARSRGFVDRRHDPVGELRQELRAELRTKRSREAISRRRHLARDGVLSAEEVGRLTAAARGDGPESLVIVLLAVECGLRRSEIAGLRWGDVAFGTGGDDPTRHVEIRQARPRGLDAEAPKSGQLRRPHLSLRLRSALRTCIEPDGSQVPTIVS